MAHLQTKVLVVLLSTASGFLAACTTGPSEADASPAGSALGPHEERQQARAASIFKNLDFEDLDATGAPIGWKCQCAGAAVACKVDDDASHGKHALVLSPGCMAIQTTTVFDPTKAVRFDYLAHGPHQYGADSLVAGWR